MTHEVLHSDILSKNAKSHNNNNNNNTGFIQPLSNRNDITQHS